MAAPLGIALLLAVLLAAAGPAAAAGLPDWEALFGGRAAGADNLARLRGQMAGSAQQHLDSLQLGGDLGLLLRASAGDSLHDYRQWGGELQGLTRRGGSWLAIAAREARSLVDQRDVYSEGDAASLEGARGSVQLAAGRRLGDLGLEALLAQGQGWGGGLTLFTRRGEAEFGVSLGVEALRWEAELDLSAHPYRFDFPLRREYFQLTLADPGAGWPRCDFRREVLKSTEAEVGDYNRLWLQHESLQLAWDPPRLPLRVTGELAAGKARLSMYADELSFLRLSRTGFAHRTAELTLGAGHRDRLILGVDEIELRAGAGSFDPFPFSFWLIFANQDYRLDDFHYRLTRWSLGYGREITAPSSRFALSAALHHEWLLGGGEVRWREKEWIVYPWFFDWVEHRQSLLLPGRALLRLQISGRLRIAAAWTLDLDLGQLALLSGGGGRGGGSSGAPAPGPETSVYGGFQGRIGLRAGWR